MSITIEVGKTYRTRDGRKVVVMGQSDEIGDCPWICLVDGTTRGWWLHGNYEPFGSHPLDLIALWDESEDEK